MKSNHIIQVLILVSEKHVGLVETPGKSTVYLGHLRLSALIDRL